jgi:1-acyl-sn-glycerol-3-phosphate acyltransferase
VKAVDADPTTPLAALPPNPPATRVHESWFSRRVYNGCWWLGRWIWFGTFDLKELHRERLDLPGGYVVACTHLSHLEPFLLGIYYRRTINWITRIEFYQHRWMIWFLSRFGAIPVRRQGVSASGVRTAIERVGNGMVIAIAPEGGVATGGRSVCRGGAIKGGAALIACRTGKPVVPVVMLGTHVLQRVGPWLPFRRAKLWIAVGEPVYPPPPTHPRKAAYAEMTGRVSASFRSAYRELVDRFGLDEGQFP